MKIHLIFYINLLQPIKGEPLICEVLLLPPVIVDNGNSSYFINLIDDMR